MGKNFVSCYYQSRVFFTVAIILFGLLFLGARVEASSPGKQAPEWVISEWINTEGLTLADLRGKVVVIDFFQLWCPGCNNFSIPLMEKWKQKYSDRKDVQLIGIHTVFEGHSQQTPERLRQYVKEKKITYPVGIDKYVSSQRLPETMVRYHTRGTPEITVIDKKGKIRFQHFGGFETSVVEKLIDSLLMRVTCSKIGILKFAVRFKSYPERVKYNSPGSAKRHPGLPINNMIFPVRDI